MSPSPSLTTLPVFVFLGITQYCRRQECILLEEHLLGYTLPFGSNDQQDTKSYKLRLLPTNQLTRTYFLLIEFHLNSTYFIIKKVVN